jgi:hypothetical protein
MGFLKELFSFSRPFLSKNTGDRSGAKTRFLSVFFDNSPAFFRSDYGKLYLSHSEAITFGSWCCVVVNCTC